MRQLARTAGFLGRILMGLGLYGARDLSAHAMRGRSEWSTAELAQLRLEGLEYLNHLLSGTATRGDAAALRRWRGRSIAHEEAFRSAVRLRRLVRGSLGGGALTRGG